VPSQVLPAWPQVNKQLLAVAFDCRFAAQSTDTDNSRLAYRRCGALLKLKLMPPAEVEASSRPNLVIMRWPNTSNVSFTKVA
jgi:hypothetical protein